MHNTKRTASLLLIVLSAALAHAAIQGPPAKPREDLPTDQERRAENAITKADQEYTVEFRGTIDGAMTRGPITYHPYVQGWQPNVSARIENVGETDVVNPWITVNGHGDWRTIKSIVADATAGCTTDAEKARALWEFQRKHRFHATTWDRESYDAVKALNVYGYTLCGDEAMILNDLWLAAGLRTRPAHPIGHAVTEVFYDNSWHLLDSDEHVICLLSDNKTLASEEQIVRDHDLMKRMHTYSMSAKENPLGDQFSTSLYFYTGERGGGRVSGTNHTMNFTLRPGEALEWRWGHVGKEYSAGIELKPGERWTTDGTGTLRTLVGEHAVALMRNGKWTYRPSLDKVLYRKGVLAEENIACGAEAGGKGGLRPAKAGPSSVTWRIASPYVFVGGTVQCQVQRKAAGDSVAMKWSSDGKTWQDLVKADQLGQSTISGNMDKLLSPRRQPMYEYFIKVEMQSADGGQAGLDSIVFDNDVQMSLLGMPEMTAGTNRVRYIDETKGERAVKVTHVWMERTAWHPPAAVKEALSPKEGEAVEGTRPTFSWTPPSAGDAGDSIADYHIEVCDRQDMRWPLSPNFEKVISLTPAAGKAQWTVPSLGLLNPDTTYYWHVRAKNGKGVWGPWSQAFTFKVAAAGVPQGVKLESDGGVPKAIVWNDNPQGRKPVSYRVYGSNEQGFTVSDSEYVVRMGNGFCDNMKEFLAKSKNPPKDDPFFGDVKTPANFVCETKQRRVDLSGKLYAFYRVAAVDEKGNVSGASDLVELPRPFIYTQASAVAKAGQEYRYQPGATVSIGHLTCRGGYNQAFWEPEKLEWTLESGPKWLSVRDGQLVGKPGDADAGSFDVVLKVTNGKEGSAQQKFKLVVEK